MKQAEHYDALIKSWLKFNKLRISYKCGKCFKCFSKKYNRDRHQNLCKPKSGIIIQKTSEVQISKLQKEPFKEVKIANYFFAKPQKLRCARCFCRVLEEDPNFKNEWNTQTEEWNKDIEQGKLEKF